DNLALGELFIRTPAPPAVGTFIHLLFDAPTGEVRARAAVQRSHPKEGMGVKFVAVEQEDRARIRGMASSSVFLNRRIIKGFKTLERSFEACQCLVARLAFLVVPLLTYRIYGAFGPWKAPDRSPILEFILPG